MKDSPTAPEPDRIEGAPHPRDTLELLGQSKAEQDFLEAYTTGRLHHAWLITGPRGIGKATLAWKIARFLLSEAPAGESGLFGDAPPAPTSLAVNPDHPVAHRMAALSEPGLFLLRRPYDQKTDKLKKEITVDEVRRMKNFFSLSAADGGRRVVIIDAADELNINAANALLKQLEEPPENTTLLLINHQPSRLLATIRSRCRELRCLPLGAEDMDRALLAAGIQSDGTAAAIGALADGSVGEAVRLINLEGLQAYQNLLILLREAPGLDRQKALALAESAVGKGRELRFDLLLGLFDLLLSRIARTGALGPPTVEAANGEGQLLQRLAPSPQAARRWAELQQNLGARVRHGRAVNLDPAALLLDMIFKIDELAAQTSAR